MTTGTAFVATCDLAAQVRGRAIPVARLARTLATGVGWVPADLALTCFGHLADDNPFGSTGDLRLLPDPAAGVDIPADGDVPGVRLHLADQTGMDGAPWPGCPRGFLTAALRDLRESTGLEIRAAFEHEFMLDGPDDEAPFSFQRLRAAEPFGTDLVALLESAGLEPECWLPEYGPGQFEITLRPASALVAADRAVVLRELVRDLARRRGRHATFVPMADPGGVGNGVHVHFSLCDQDGTPVMYDAAAPGRLSAVAAKFAAGILRHAAALVAVTAPNPVSYLRLTPHRWSAGGVFLAERNREALLRITPTVEIGGARPAPQLHLEYRAADATANPWLVLGVLVRAGLAGLEKDEPVRVWPESATEADLAGEPALPASLTRALAALEKDEVARGWFPPELLDAFLAVRRAELAEVAELSPAELCRKVADVY
ncbi:glutamine synthetase [Microbispora cellulosiformans]|uniref:Glutamine synthetase n=1 Tax=Microbispora cellulosiformans TaxID=2614688 RepID=A0A5J5K7S9_9ACTN|nr:glutamine synthetase family protein [Microbispora cellulosiformans]KAA9380810.1 glutamine synthetase [Microbispora cellulosiformans]